MQSKLSAEILYPPSFKAPWKANGRHYKLFETNLLMPEGVAFTLSKFGVDTPQGGKVMSAARTDKQTRQTAFQLYIVDIRTILVLQMAYSYNRSSFVL